MDNDEQMELTYQAMMECSGMTDENTIALKNALDSVHAAVNMLDARQLSLFRNTMLGRFTVASASLYGQSQPKLKSTFT